jgi:Fe-S-cluster containining protein
MNSLKKYIEQIYVQHDLQSSAERRSELIKEMEQLEGKTIHCYTCPGTCCTAQANSMQITPIEALEILQGLKVDEWSPADKDKFTQHMMATVSLYRLDKEVYTGKKNSSSLRKNYTCPFFNNGSLGCGLSRSIKPYGCLGFNPKAAEDNGQSCASNTELLQSRDETFMSAEDNANSSIQNDLNLYWKKLNIPEALLEILKKL